MRRLWSSLVLSAAVVAPTESATVLSRRVDISIQPNGRVNETHALRIRIDTQADIRDWSPYAIWADENRKVEIDVAAVQKPDGSTVKVDKKSLDTVGVTGEGVLHGSQRVKTVTFPEAPIGSVLLLSYRVEIRPYFPADTLAVLSGAPTEDLQIRISGGGPGFRYRLDDPPPEAQITPIPGGVAVIGRALPAQLRLDYLSKADTVGPVLRYGWGGASRWEDVGDWYLALLGDVPLGSATIRQEALTLKGEDDRATVARVVDHVRSRIRYVAVEVGIGGYRPYAPEEVRAKAWGDCKDKATLLIDLLAANGIEAFPVLILSSTNGRVDDEFPSADQFNHMIVAIPEGRLGGGEGLPVAGRYFFVDPTQEEGGLTWLGTSIQDQNALVVRRGASHIVRTPRLSGGNDRVTEVVIHPRPEGGFGGEATLRFRGESASYLQLRAATRRAEEFRGEAEAMVRGRLPGGEVAVSSWTEGSGDIPEMTLAADVALSLPPGARSLVLPARPLTPPLSLVEDREADVVLEIPVSTTRWRIELPDGWCAPALVPQRVENPIGLFHQTVTVDGSEVTVERHLEIRTPWISKAQFPQFRELVLAEHRAHARSIRFDCEAAPGG